MKKQLRSFVGLLLLFNVSVCFAQNADNVNHLAGTATVYMPVYKGSSGGIPSPNNLIYNATSTKPKDIKGRSCRGWQLAAGGQITRNLRVLPDDFEIARGSDSEGLTYNNNPDSIQNFAIQNDSGITCSKEIIDISYINTDATSGNIMAFTIHNEVIKYMFSACSIISMTTTFPISPINIPSVLSNCIKGMVPLNLIFNHD